jgi:hypothetical protein
MLRDEEEKDVKEKIEMKRMNKIVEKELNHEMNTNNSILLAQT